MTNRSPEAIEEMLWTKFFDHLHDETMSNVLDRSTSNPRFERFYRDHIRKLLWSRGKQIYAAKNNNITRMDYLHSLFPAAKFIVIVRNPVNHIASYLKLHRLEIEYQQTEGPIAARFDALLGHFEFAGNLKFITIDPATTAAIRGLWDKGNHVHALATYWSALYGFVADQLQANPTLARACLVVKHEDLSTRSAETLDALIRHTQLPAAPFAPIREQYCATLRLPDCYEPNFTAEELAQIVEVTSETALRFGY